MFPTLIILTMFAYLLIVIFTTVCIKFVLLTVTEIQLNVQNGYLHQLIRSRNFDFRTVISSFIFFLRIKIDNLEQHASQKLAADLEILFSK